MRFAASSSVGFIAGGNEGIWVAGSSVFAGLDDGDREVLSHWLARAGFRGIDAAIDLSVRPWGVSGAGVIIGVFDAGEDRASWLIVGHHAEWTLARCCDGLISDVMTSLPAALALIDAGRVVDL
jgi:ABC-type uncharacterized transport system permease subunit